MPTVETAIPQLLSRVPLLSDLSDDTLHALASEARIVDVDKGEVLFGAGDLPRALHILVDGCVQLNAAALDGREAVVELVRPVDVFILAAVLTAQPYLMSAKAVEPSRLLLIPAPVVLARVNADPRLALTMLASMAQQYRMLVRQIKDLRLRTTAQRLGVYLLRCIETEGAGDQLLLRYDKKLLASRLDMTPESLSRSITVLRSYGVVVEHSQVRITDLDKLQRFCGVDNLLDRLEEDLCVLGTEGY